MKVYLDSAISDRDCELPASIHEQQIIKDVLAGRKFRTAIDIGSHAGTWALPLAGVSDNVCAFDANWRMISVLQNNAYANRITNIKAYPYGLWSRIESGSLKMYDHAGHSTLVDNHWDKQEVGSVRCIDNIKLYPLDHFGIRDIDFIKIDVEGVELEVLEGAKQTLAINHPLLFIEVHTENAWAQLLKIYPDRKEHKYGNARYIEVHG